MENAAIQAGELELFKEKIKDIRISVLTTLEQDGDLHGRPMYTHGVEPDGTLWYFTYEDSNKVREIRQNNRVALGFSNESSETYVNAAGIAQVVRDQAKIDELWNDGLKAWFPNGKGDPNITLLKIKMHQAEYWDRAGGRMATLFQQVKAALTGQPDTTARNEKLGEEPE